MEDMILAEKDLLVLKSGFKTPNYFE